MKFNLRVIHDSWLFPTLTTSIWWDDFCL